MARTMYDSITPTDIPLTAAMVAGYVDGPFAWSPAGWARFSSAVHVRIATRASTNDGHVLDVEPGDATATQAVAWVLMRRRAGADPTVYCGQSAWAAIQAAFAAAHVTQPHYWVAHYDGDPTIPAGAVAKQYTDPPNSGGHWDLSAVADHWPGVDKETTMDLTKQNLDDIAHAVAAYKLNEADPDMHQHGVDATTALGAVKTLGTSVQTAFTNMQNSFNALAAEVAALKAGQTPGTLSGDATVTVHLTPGN
jgi:hypothetical protein